MQESNVTNNANQRTPPTSWRDVVSVHPAAELLPRMSDAELKKLGEDIKANGLHTPIILLQKEDGTEQLLDGISRLDAMERVGIKVVKDDGFDRYRVLHQHVRENTDVIRFVLSVNLFRRHLTNELKSDLIGKLLELMPTASDRKIAGMTGTSHPKVAKVRRDMESRGKISTSLTRTDAMGRKQPASKPSKTDTTVEPKPDTTVEPKPAQTGTAAVTSDTTPKPAVEQKPESEVFEADHSNSKELDVLAPLWDVIEAIDRVKELGQCEATQTALATLSQTEKKKISKSWCELCKILKILRTDFGKAANKTEPGDIKPVFEKPITEISDVDRVLKNWRRRPTSELVELRLAVRRAAGRGLSLLTAHWQILDAIKTEIAVREKTEAAITVSKAA